MKSLCFDLIAAAAGLIGAGLIAAGCPIIGVLLAGLAVLVFAMMTAADLRSIDRSMDRTEQTLKKSRKQLQ